MIWRHLGFNRDIFFVEPLRPSAEDIKLFVGRDVEIRKYLIDTLSGSRALKIVTGDIGVGKTTFVNACQYYSFAKTVPFDFQFEIPHILPCFEKIQIRETDTIDDFFLQAITSICQSIVFYCRLTEKEPPKEIKEFLSNFLDLAVNTGGAGWNAGANVGLVGLSVGGAQRTKAQNIIRNAKIHLRRLVEIAKVEFDFQGVFVIVNNLDILSKEKLISFLNMARDEVFDITGIYWTLIGRKGIGSIIETESDRVADYLSGTELFIGPMDFSNTKKVIDIRVEEFRQSNKVKCPLSDDSIYIFHRMSLQEIRETLKICGEIVKRVIMINPSLIVIPDEIAIESFIQYANERAKDIDLSEAAIKTLNAVFDQESCRPKDYAKFGYRNAPAFISTLKGLVGKRLLSVEERGRARIYRMTGMTMIAALSGMLGNDIYKSAHDKLRELPRKNVEKDQFKIAQMELDLEE